MRFQNTNQAADLMLDREDGAGGFVMLPPRATIDASSYYDTPIMRRQGLVRVASGRLFGPLVGANPMVVVVGGRLKVDGTQPTDAEILWYSGVNLAATPPYTAYGRVQWSDANGQHQADFMINGHGQHGITSTFVVQAVPGAAIAPTANGSSIDRRNGELRLAFTGAAFVGGVNLWLVEDHMAPMVNYSVGSLGDNTVKGPAVNQRLLYVQPADVDGVEYVGGSQGMCKEIREFASGAQVGGFCRVTRFRYKDVNQPIRPTHIATTIEQVVAEDIN